MQAVRAKLNIEGGYSRILDAVRCEYATVFNFQNNPELLILNDTFLGLRRRVYCRTVQALNFFKINRLEYSDVCVV